MKPSTPHVGPAGAGLAEHLDALVGEKSRFLDMLTPDGDHDLVEELGGPLDDVEVAVGHRVEGPGADSSTHGVLGQRVTPDRGSRGRAA